MHAFNFEIQKWVKLLKSPRLNVQISPDEGNDTHTYL